MAPLTEMMTPFASAAIPSVVGGLMTALFLRGNTSSSEFEKIKAGKFSEALDDLLEARKMSYLELYKCRNFLSIAKKADEMYAETTEEDDARNDAHEFDFDWFLRFFNGASNISNESMQFLWAKVLAGEVTKPGSCSFRTLEVLSVLSRTEAELFQQVIDLVVVSNYSNVILLDPGHHLAIDGEDIYDISDPEFDVLEESGLINSALFWDPLDAPRSKLLLENPTAKLTVTLKDGKSSNLQLRTFNLTRAARQLLDVLNISPSDEYINLLATTIRNQFGECVSVRVSKRKKAVSWRELQTQNVD